MRRSIHSSLFLVISLLVSTGIGCSGEPAPTRPVQLAGFLDMKIDDAWDLEASGPEGRVYLHRQLGEVRLHIEARNEDLEGGPLQVQSVKSLLGRELNSVYGGVISRVSMGGNAMIHYERAVTDEYDDTLHSEEWVLARPSGYSHIARIDISLQMPPEIASDPRIIALVEGLDQQVGDARIPQA